MSTNDIPSQSVWRNYNYHHMPESFVINRGTASPLKVLSAVAYTTLTFFTFVLPIFFFTAKNYKVSRLMLHILHSLMLVVGIFLFVGEVLDLLNGSKGSLAFVIYTIILMLLSRIYLKKDKSSIAVGLPANNSQVPTYLKDIKIFGTVGDLSNAVGKFTAENIAKGEEGEKRSAVLMNDLLTIPGTRIFHGVEWPGSQNADIDHIIVNGNKIAFVDSKMWTGFTHTMTTRGTVSSYMGNNKANIQRDMKLPKAMASMNRYLHTRGIKDTTPYGWLAIHRSDKKKVQVNNEYNPGIPVMLGDAQDVIDFIGTWFSTDTQGIVYKKVIDALMAKLK